MPIYFANASTGQRANKAFADTAWQGELFCVREFWGVCHRRTALIREPLTCKNILATSRWVWGQLNTLASICGSHGVWAGRTFPAMPDPAGMVVPPEDR
jgi:hypothetical protein